MDSAPDYLVGELRTRTATSGTDKLCLSASPQRRSRAPTTYLVPSSDAPRPRPRVLSCSSWHGLCRNMRLNIDPFDVAELHARAQPNKMRQTNAIDAIRSWACPSPLVCGGFNETQMKTRYVKPKTSVTRTWSFTGSSGHINLRRLSTAIFLNN